MDGYNKNKIGTTTLVKTLGTLTQQLVKMTHFLTPPPPPRPPPSSVLTLWLHIFFNTINIAKGRRGQQQQALIAFITDKICC